MKGDRVRQYIGTAVILTMFFVASPLPAQTTEGDLRREIEEKSAELQKIQAEREQVEKVLEETEQAKNTLSREIRVVDYQIQQLDLSVKANRLNLEKLALEIETASEDIPLIEESIKKTREILSKKYNCKVVFFEHGAGDDTAKKAGCCVAHAHIHAVPVPSDINFDLFEKDLEAYVGELRKQKINKLQELSKIVKKDSSYLLYINSDDERFVFDIGEKQIPSQMFRKYISILPKIMESNASWLKNNGIEGIDNFTWDWRQFRPADRYNKTANYLLSEFKEGLYETSKG